MEIKVIEVRKGEEKITFVLAASGCRCVDNGAVNTMKN